tara:strand:- start:36 stop:890 length:855 start_codon:yes stop_codon:yes gene_type:complete
MSNKKNLLNESQIRQFMKLAKLEPLTPGFVKGLAESNTIEEDLEESHGRGRGEGPAGYGAPVDAGRAGARLREIEDPEAELEADPGLEGDEAVDLPVVDPEAEEVMEPGAEDVPTEEEVLDALQIIARAAGVEGIEIEATSTGEPSELEPEVGLEPELPGEEGPEELEEPGLEELEEGDEEELEEILGFGKSKADKAREKLALGSKGSYDPDPEAGEESSAPTPEEAAAARKKPVGRTRSPAGATTYGLGSTYGGVREGNTDELVEQITKRVAARILKAALRKK